MKKLACHSDRQWKKLISHAGHQFIVSNMEIGVPSACPWSKALRLEDKKHSRVMRHLLFCLRQRQQRQACWRTYGHLWYDTHIPQIYVTCVPLCAHAAPLSELSILPISLLQQENKQAPAAASQQSTFSYIVVTYKELNINALLCIDWKNTCHYNGLVDISE